MDIIKYTNLNERNHILYNIVSISILCILYNIQYICTK